MSDNHSLKPDDHSHNHVLFVDREKFEWANDQISGAELRAVAGVPDDVQIFEQVPGHPDREIAATTVINLDQQKGPLHFSTQSAGSQAG